MSDGLSVVVAGAGGFIGRRLVPALIDAGHDVTALGRRPHRHDTRARSVRVDVHEPASLTAALRGADVAVYLIHELAAGHDDQSLPHRERESGELFGEAAARAGVDQIVYLGGLATSSADLDPRSLSPHLLGRRLTETALGAQGVPVTVVRAGIVLGPGSIGWEMMRQLAERVPLLVAPRRSSSRTQPIAADDLIGYLVDVTGAAHFHGRMFEVGTDDVVSYRDLMARVARAHGHRGVVVRAPYLPSVVMEAALAALTDVHRPTAMALLASMHHDAVVNDDSVRRLLPRRPLPVDAAIRRAVDEESGSSVRAG